MREREGEHAREREREKGRGSAQRAIEEEETCQLVDQLVTTTTS